MKNMKKISYIYELIIILMISLMFIIVGINVFSRFIFNRSIDWADELPRYLFIWFSFLAAVIAYAADEHIGIDLLIKKITNEKQKKIVLIFTHTLTLIFFMFLAVYGTMLCFSVNNYSPILEIPMNYIFSVIPISAGLLFILNIIKIKNISNKIKKKTKAY